MMASATSSCARSGRSRWLRVPHALANLGLLLALLVGQASAHGYLSVPPARNIGDSCRQCLAGGGPATINTGGQYKVCGRMHVSNLESSTNRTVDRSNNVLLQGRSALKTANCGICARAL